uniref:Uncharacterized protein n=1 Tax=Guillardia theta (strain CCMP2712) TaxID=905079 RepID=A0A0C3SKZ6_GUITC
MAVFTNPFDVAKVRMQLQRSCLSALNLISDAPQGLEGTQRGLTAAIIREGSKNFFRIGLFEPVLDQLHGTEHKTAPVWKRLVAGGISGAVGAMICNPIEIVKTRLQGYKYKGFLDSFRVITRQEGASALWLGTGISTIRSILATSANMTVNSIRQADFLCLPSSHHYGVCAMFSGLACVAANNPADVIRTRLYNQPFKIVNGKRVGEYYPSTLGCAMSILRSEGPLAFWKGFTGHYLRTGPHYIVCFVFIGTQD